MTTVKDFIKKRLDQKQKDNSVSRMEETIYTNITTLDTVHVTLLSIACFKL